MSPRPWSRRLAVLAGLTAAIAVGYFATGHRMMRGLGACSPATPLDALLPFVPWFIVIYASMWLLWWVPAWSATADRFRHFVIAAAAVNAVAFAVFLACRDEGVRQSIGDLGQPLRAMYEGLYAIDPAGNRFPSLHAADTVLVLRSLARSPGHGWYVAWGALVIVASVLTRQHGLVDIAAGVGLAAVVSVLVGRFESRASAAR